jgi:hypothetical protein
VCLIQRSLEANGIATVMLSLMRGRTLALKPPRAMLTKQQFSYTAGPPGDRDTQYAILNAAVSLLPRHEGTILETFGKGE